MSQLLGSQGNPWLAKLCCSQRELSVRPLLARGVNLLWERLLNQCPSSVASGLAKCPSALCGAGPEGSPLGVWVVEPGAAGAAACGWGPAFPPSRLISGQGTLRHCPGLGWSPIIGHCWGHLARAALCSLQMLALGSTAPPVLPLPSPWR